MDMGLKNKIQKAVWNFASISLKEMDKVSLMRRTDTKFVFNTDYLPQILEQVKNNYYMVEIKGEREQLYQTTYFDTIDYQMYQVHHNGKLNRHKIRIRQYIYTQQEFLEIKQKNNRGETIKKRIEQENNSPQLKIKESQEFINNNSPYNSKSLIPTLGNHFVRLTLVNKDFSERITLDYKLKFTDLKYNSETNTNEICIAEIKKNRNNKKSPFLKTLKDHKIQSMGFSKYCIGLALLNPDIKNNNFKQRIRSLAKV